MKWLRVGLEIVGAMALVAILFLAVSAFVELRGPRIDKAKPKDILFVLNAAGVSVKQNLKVLASYESQRSFNGDHLDYYCISLEKFDPSDFTKEDWHVGPEKDPILSDALKLALDTGRNDGGNCLPASEKANSPEMKIMLPKVVLNGRQPSAAEVILYDPKTSTLYYVGYKT